MTLEEVDKHAELRGFKKDGRLKWTYKTFDFEPLPQFGSDGKLRAITRQTTTDAAKGTVIIRIMWRDARYRRTPTVDGPCERF